MDEIKYFVQSRELCQECDGFGCPKCEGSGYIEKLIDLEDALKQLYITDRLPFDDLTKVLR